LATADKSKTSIEIQGSHDYDTKDRKFKKSEPQWDKEKNWLNLI